MRELETVYLPGFDLRTLTNEQRKAFSQHTFMHFPTAAFVALHFVTVGIFTTVYCGLKHSRLPIIKHDDFKAGKAIGYLFTPFFNFYWIFKFWLRLVDRVNFQFRLRNQAPPVSRGLPLAMAILIIIAAFTGNAAARGAPFEVWLVPFLITFVIMLIVAVQIQNATNKLAGESRFGEVPVSPVFCSKCGKENPPLAEFCSNCGAKLISSAVPEFCPKCGMKVSPDDKYCKSCGAKLV